MPCDFATSPIPLLDKLFQAFSFLGFCGDYALRGRFVYKRQNEVDRWCAASPNSSLDAVLKNCYSILPLSFKPQKNTTKKHTTKSPLRGCLVIFRRKIWRRGPESNRPTRICNPVHNRFATAPFLVTKKGSCCFPNLQKDVGSSFNVWSGIRGSNSRPIPWQGIALPTELIPHLQSTKHSMPICLHGAHCSAIFNNY